jgi:hypothetical protein
MTRLSRPLALQSPRHGQHGRCLAVPEAVAAFHEAERRVRPSTIGRRIAAIRYAHKLAELPLPTDDERVRATMRGNPPLARHPTGQENTSHRRRFV